MLFKQCSIPIACQISEAEKVALQKIDPRSANMYCLAKQMQRDNLGVIGEKSVENDAFQLSLEEKAKKAFWKEQN